jgi:hypothetical protein
MSDVKIRLRNAEGEIVANDRDALKGKTHRVSGVAAGPTRWATAQDDYPGFDPNVPDGGEPERRPGFGRFNSWGGKPPPGTR